jgi:nucleotide-binding universal stress UspA family protein
VTKRKVLIPLDGSDFSRQILEVVCDYFCKEDVDLVLMRVSTPALLTAESRSYAGLLAEQSYMGVYGNYTPQQERIWAMSAQESDTYRKELQIELEQEAERLRAQGYHVITEVHFGDPAQRIIDFVNDMNINMIAMTTHGRTGLGRLVLGSVAEQVLRGVHVPVLLWRSTTPTPTLSIAPETGNANG